MKTWEMIKELTENPEKKFKSFEFGQVEMHSGCLVDSEFMECILVDSDFFRAEWEEVKEPVDFIEAVKSGKKIRSVTWMQNTELDLPNLLYDMSDFDEEEIRQLLLGKWYIEED